MTPGELKALRKELGMTQETFGQALGYAYPKVRISELEHGRKNISSQVEIICAYLQRYGPLKIKKRS